MRKRPGSKLHEQSALIRMATRKGSSKPSPKEKKPSLEMEPVELPDDFPADFAQVIEKIPDPKSRQAVISMITASVRIHRGPLPPPEDLKAYEEIIPGAAREILDMAKSQHDYRQRTETGIIEHSKRQENWTQIIGAFVIFTVIGCGVLAMYMSQPLVACTIFGTTIASIAITFLTGKKTNSKSKK